jgi:hypothetical protein
LRYELPTGVRSVHKPVSKAGVAAGGGSTSKKIDSHGGQHVHPKIDRPKGY